MIIFANRHYKVIIGQGNNIDLNLNSFTEILDAVYDGLYITDLERKIIFWNKAAEKITGFTAQEVVGKHCSDNILVHIDDAGNKLCLGVCPLTKAIKT